jgi:hypothetical protein
LEKNNVIIGILNSVDVLKIPNWYLAAGCIAQTVWNELHSFPLVANIKDYDIVYFDDSDLSYEGEDAVIKEIQRDSSQTSQLGSKCEMKQERLKGFGV